MFIFFKPAYNLQISINVFIIITKKLKCCVTYKLCITIQPIMWNIFPVASLKTRFIYISTNVFTKTHKFLLKMSLCWKPNFLNGTAYSYSNIPGKNCAREWKRDWNKKGAQRKLLMRYYKIFHFVVINRHLFSGPIQCLKKLIICYLSNSIIWMNRYTRRYIN